MWKDYDPERDEKYLPELQRAFLGLGCGLVLTGLGIVLALFLATYVFDLTLIPLK